MKNIILPAIFLLCGTAVAAQITDTTFIDIRQEAGQLEKQQWSAPYDLVFGTMERTRWLFTLSAAPLLSDVNSHPYSAEVKILPGLSLRGAFGLQGQKAFGIKEIPSSFGYSLALEPRWYYAMPRLIREGKSANNMSGNYISLQSTYRYLNYSNRSRNETEQSLSLRYGIQRRLLRYGFLDMSFGAGIIKKSPSYTQTDKWALFASSKIGVGLALARPKSRPAEGGYCDALRCFREEKKMLKIDLYDFIKIDDFNNYKTGLSVGYERKIGNSPFSVELQGSGSYGHGYIKIGDENGYGYEITSKSNTYGIALQPRYYYAQKKRIARGKSGSNLSGAYIATQLRWTDTRSRSEGYQCGVAGCMPIDNQYTNKGIGAGILWGAQYRLFKHGFIDFNIGNEIYDGQVVSTQNGVSVPEKERYYVNFTGKLRVGFAF